MVISPLKGIGAYVPTQFSFGCDVDCASTSGFADAVKVAAAADVAIVVMGLDQVCSACTVYLLVCERDIVACVCVCGLSSIAPRIRLSHPCTCILTHTHTQTRTRAHSQSARGEKAKDMTELSSVFQEINYLCCNRFLQYNQRRY